MNKPTTATPTTKKSAGWKFSTGTPKSALSSAKLLKDLKRSVSDFMYSSMSPIKSPSSCTTMHDDTIDRIVLSEEVYRGKPSPQRANSIDPYVSASEFRAAILKSTIQSTFIECSDASPDADSAQNKAVNVNQAATTRINLVIDQEEEQECRKQLSRLELILEDLRVDVAVRLAVAQSISQKSKRPVGDLKEFLRQPFGDYDTTTNLPLQQSSASKLASQESSRASIATESSPGVRQASNSGKIKSATYNALQIFNFESLSTDKLDNSQSLDVLAHFDEKGFRKTPLLSECGLRISLSTSIAKSTRCFPSSATTDAEYINLLLKLPVLCFVDQLSLAEPLAMPQIKQDSKDLTRDVVHINGIRVSGVAGYKHVYQCLANNLLPPASRMAYATIDYNWQATVSDKSNFPISEVTEPKNTPSYSNSTQVENEAIIEECCMAEIRALLLLHFVNRTLAGGHGFEKVMTVFGNDELSLIVPNSKAAKPLDIILPKDEENKVTAIIRSHTSFKVFPAASTPDALNCYADVDVHFMADIDIMSTLNEAVVGKACASIVDDLNLLYSKPGACELLPERLIQWAVKMVQKVSSSDAASSIANHLNYRVYLSPSTSM